MFIIAIYFVLSDCGRDLSSFATKENTVYVLKGHLLRCQMTNRYTRSILVILTWMHRGRHLVINDSYRLNISKTIMFIIMFIIAICSFSHKQIHTPNNCLPAICYTCPHIGKRICQTRLSTTAVYMVLADQARPRKLSGLRPRCLYDYNTYRCTCRSS